MSAMISPASLSLVQHAFIDQLGAAFSKITAIAEQLFYVIAGIELAIFGLVWALRQQEMLGAFLFKVLKLGMIFFVISYFPALLQVLIDGFTKVAFATVPEQTATYIFNPGGIWKYGFDAGISLLNLAVTYGTSNDGITLIYIILGFGILLMFGLIAAQIILAVVAFYVVSLLALLLIPLGAFTPAKNLFERAIQSVFSAGARVFALIVVIGVAVSVWAQFNVGGFSNTTTIDIPLGMFFVTLIFLVLSVKLPAIAAKTVGQLGGALLLDMPSASHTSVHVTGAMPAASVSTVGLAAAANISGGTAASNLNNVAAGAQVVAGIGASSTGPASIVTTAAGSGIAADKGNKVREGADLSRGISRETLSKLKATFRQVINEQSKS